MSDIPIACSLNAAELATRARRWRKLADRALIGVAKTSDGLVIRFRREPGVLAELRELAVAEQECCGFAEWTTDAEEHADMLRIRGRGEDAVATVQQMFTDLTPAVG